MKQIMYNASYQDVRDGFVEAASALKEFAQGIDFLQEWSSDMFDDEPKSFGFFNSDQISEEPVCTSSRNRNQQHKVKVNFENIFLCLFLRRSNFVFA